jgi:predicted nucleic acid-binding protein
MYLLDFSVVIPCLRHASRLVYTTFIQHLPTALVHLISVITRFEIIRGTIPQQTTHTHRFLSALNEIDVTPAIAERAGYLYRDCKAKGYPHEAADLLIGATALDGNLILLTTNPKHFPYLREVRVEEVEFRTRKGTRQKDRISFMEP